MASPRALHHATHLGGEAGCCVLRTVHSHITTSQRDDGARGSSASTSPTVSLFVHSSCKPWASISCQRESFSVFSHKYTAVAQVL